MREIYANSVINVFLVSENPGEGSHVFIHGYMATLRQKDRDLIVDSIKNLQLSGSSYLVIWNSILSIGVENLSVLSNKRLPRSSPCNYMRLSKIFSKAFRITGARVRGADPKKVVIGGAIVFVGVVANDFISKQNYTLKVADSLAVFINQFLAQKSGPVNITGHSLGGRIVYHLLANKNNILKSKIQNAILLAAAVSNNEDWGPVGENLSDTLYNIHNKKLLGDVPLSFKPRATLGTDIGRVGLINEKIKGKVVNLDLGLPHTQYWENLLPVFGYIEKHMEELKKAS